MLHWLLFWRRRSGWWRRLPTVKLAALPVLLLCREMLNAALAALLAEETRSMEVLTSTHTYCATWTVVLCREMLDAALAAPLDRTVEGAYKHSRLNCHLNPCLVKGDAECCADSASGGGDQGGGGAAGCGHAR